MVPLMDSENRQTALLYLPSLFSTLFSLLLLSKSNQMRINRQPIEFFPRTCKPVHLRNKVCRQVGASNAAINYNEPSVKRIVTNPQRLERKDPRIAEVAQAAGPSPSLSTRGARANCLIPQGEMKRNVLSWQASLVDINSSHGRSGAS